MVETHLSLRDKEGVWHRDIATDFALPPRIGEHIEYRDYAQHNDTEDKPSELDGTYQIVRIIHFPATPDANYTTVHAVWLGSPNIFDPDPEDGTLPDVDLSARRLF